MEKFRPWTFRNLEIDISLMLSLAWPLEHYRIPATRAAKEKDLERVNECQEIVISLSKGPWEASLNLSFNNCILKHEQSFFAHKKLEGRGNLQININCVKHTTAPCC